MIRNAMRVHDLAGSHLRIAVPGCRRHIFQADLPMRQVVGEGDIGREDLVDIQSHAVLGGGSQCVGRSQVLGITGKEMPFPLRPRKWNDGKAYIPVRRCPGRWS